MLTGGLLLTSFHPQPTDIPPVPWSVQMVDSVMRRGVPYRWHYENGLLHRAVEQVWHRTGDSQYYDYIEGDVDRFVDAAGNINTYNLADYNLDQIQAGRILFLLYRTTEDERYKRAICLLRDQLRTQPRTGEGGFWHKKVYPHQMWLDGIYMASPFHAEFARTFDEPASFDDIAHQITLIEKHTRDNQTGLLYHAWDENRQQRWANAATGCSQHFWGRAIGWYVMAIVDVLDYFPTAHVKRAELIAILHRTLDAVAKVQDHSTGLWYQVLDQGDRAGNYFEASASCMFVYAMCKGVRKGYLPPNHLELARKGYRGIHGKLIEIDGQGLVNLNWICETAGLGGTPYRDGSYEYYVGEKIVTNDYKGVGAFILASVEMEQAQ